LTLGGEMGSDVDQIAAPTEFQRLAEAIRQADTSKIDAPTLEAFEVARRTLAVLKRLEASSKR
jgi:hypothetical protein